MTIKGTPEYRWFNAYTAWQNAKNPKFKKYWFTVMSHLMPEFKNA